MDRLFDEQLPNCLKGRMIFMRDNSDRSWERWGKDNPYYGVLTDDRFRRENLHDDRKMEFLETGNIM